MLSLKIQGRILTAADGDAYTAALQRDSPVSVLPAKYIVQVAVIADITAVLDWNAWQKPPLEIAVKGGGAHSSNWSSTDGGIVIDLTNLKAVTVSPDRQVVTIQGGALWGDVYAETKKVGVDVVGGPLWFIGVGGFVLGGGYGPVSGTRGLAVDTLISATMVLATGKVVKASATSETELFWAIRGGGGQFGVLAELQIKAFPTVGPITNGVLVYPGAELANVLQVVKAFKQTYTGKEKLNMNFTRSAPTFNPSILILPWVSEDVDSARSKTILAPFRTGTIKPLVDTCALLPDMLAVSHNADASIAAAPKRLRIRGTLFADYYEELIVGVYQRWLDFTATSVDVRGTAVLWDLTRAEKLGEVHSGDTAVHVRDNNYWVALQGRTDNPAADDAVKAWLATTVAFIRQKNTELSGKDYGLFLSMAQGDTETPQDVFGPNLPRLSKAKAQYDPKQVFKRGIAIPPDAGGRCNIF